MEEAKLTFNDVPEVLAIVLSKLEALREKIDRLVPTTGKEEKQWLNVSELSAYLPSHPREQTIYSWTCAHKIPFHKKGRSVMFDKNEIDNWLMDGTFHKSEQDLEREALQFVNKKRVYNINV